MELKSYLINMILGFNNHKYTKLELYTLTCNELSTIKNDLLESDDVTVECYGE